MIIAQSTQQWVQQILKNPKDFESKFVVHTQKEVVFCSEHLQEAEVWVKKNVSNYLEELLIFLVPAHFEQIRLRMLKIKSLSAGEWMPMYPVVFVLPDGKFTKIEMLVDSGADVTFIPFKLGKHLGFSKSFGEATLTALGVGSEVPYLIREHKIRINDVELIIHLLWGQDETLGDILLGRLDVFDHFDIIFSQHRQKIFFEPISKEILV
jgi:hypothetical protein